MPLNKYRVLAKIAERGKMRLAAQDLMYSKQNMSRIIKDMEEECGFALFIRDRDGVQLTSEAREILPIVDRIVEEEDSLYDKINEIKERQVENEKSVTIGACGSIAIDLVKTVLEESKTKCDFPVTVEFFVDGDHFADGLRSGKMNFALIADGYQRDFNYETLCKDRFVAIRAAKKEEPAPASISMGEVLQHPTIITPDCPLYDDIMSDKSNRRITVDDELIMVPIVEHGDYYGIAARIPYYYPNDERIDIIPLDEKIFRTVGIASCPGKRQSKEAEIIKSMLKEIVENRVQ